MKGKLVFLSFIFSVFWGGFVCAQGLSERYYKGIYALQPKKTIFKKHFQVNLNFVYVTNEVYFNEIGGEIGAFYNFLENMSAGLSFTQYKGFTTSFYREVQENFDIFPERVMNQYSFDAHYIWTPVFGKFVLFGSPIINFKTSLISGLGVLKTSTKSFHPSVRLGVLFTFCINRLLVLNLSFSDQIYYEDYKKEGELKNQILFKLGLGFLFSL